MAKRIALIGTPNAGKTALFNVLTKSNQRVANYSGVTIESAEADIWLPELDEKAVLVDLPGAYSLQPFSEEEKVLLDLIENQKFDSMILVIDSTQLERGIRFVLEVLSVSAAPAVIALNMGDLAQKRGIEISLKNLPGGRLEGVEVVMTSATKRKGLKELVQAVSRSLGTKREKLNLFLDIKKSDQILSFYKLADDWVGKIRTKTGTEDILSKRLDRYVLHPVWGWLILLSVLAVTFQLMFNLAQYPMDWIDSFFGYLGEQVANLSIPETAKSFLIDGLIAGVGGTLVFLPQILILFALILFLEDFGFMARAVMLLDHAMGRVGLHGRAFLPILSSYACAIPGMMAAKAIESKNDRIVTILMIPLTTCSARLPVYALLISAFIPNVEVLGGVKLQGLVMLGLYIAGLLFALIAGALFKKFLLKGARPPLFLELPGYKWPSLQSVVKGLIYRGQLFLKRVGTIILALTILIWFMVSFPKDEQGQVQVEHSYAAQVGHLIEPLIRPLGFDWKIGMALVPTFAAREVMVSALATTYAVEGNSNEGETSESEEAIEERLSQIISSQWSLATGLSLIAWFIFAPMCISTIATARRELGSTKWALVMVAYLFALAYLASFITFQVFR